METKPITKWTIGDGDYWTDYTLWEEGVDQADARATYSNPDGYRCSCTHCQNDWDCCGNVSLGCVSVDFVKIDGREHVVTYQSASRNV